MGWQATLRNSISNPSQLNVKDAVLDGFSESANRQFAMRIPQAFHDLIDPEDDRDPLLRQVLPHAHEDLPAAGYNADPLAER
ncbi:MAG: EF-P beta-lysylation protein EpmB, partial [Gammaproteobacteria bacterium]|nr:EF-P beta-lysylation protein EpmB [Gammaproteobacteria bacterium]